MVVKKAKIGLLGFSGTIIFTAAALVGLGGFIFVGEVQAGESGAVEPALDSDGDGLSDADELGKYFTDPANPDTDGDGYDDGLEIASGYSPRFAEAKKLIDADSDLDYLNDAWELAAGTGLLNPDSDGDLYLDGTEVAASYDPLNRQPIKLAKRIEVNLAEQRLSYWFADKLFGSFLISGGTKNWPTPVGDFQIIDKVPVKFYRGAGWDYPNTKWNLQFAKKKYNYFIHGAYWHSNWGKPMSHGCVNVSYENMEKLYWWAQYGTPVAIR